MKKLAIILMIFLLSLSLVFAAQGEAKGSDDTAKPEDTGMDDAGQPEDTGMGEQTQTENKGEETQNRVRVEAGEYSNEAGQKLMVQEKENNRLGLKSNGVEAETGMEMNQEGNKLKVKLSNGKDSEVKIMPDTASETALTRLRMKVCAEGCTIELKEVGQGEQTRAAYEMQAQKEAKVLGLFKTKMRVNAQVDAENGEVIKSGKPWWAFLASETEE